eukprot:6855145-Prymnesium_polylepis.1
MRQAARAAGMPSFFGDMHDLLNEAISESSDDDDAPADEPRSRGHDFAEDLQRRAGVHSQHAHAPPGRYDASGLQRVSKTLLKVQPSAKVGMRLCDAPDPRHVLVDSVSVGGMAEIGGVCKDDIIVAINGAQLNGREDAIARIAKASPLLVLEILRK